MNPEEILRDIYKRAVATLRAYSAIGLDLLDKPPYSVA